MQSHETYIDWQAIIDRYYNDNRALRQRLVSHSDAVARLALAIAKHDTLPLDPEVVRAAAMLHDIGIVATDAPGIDCLGNEPYIRHGIIGARMLRREGVPEIYARVAERHTGTGITQHDIVDGNLPLPPGQYMPTTLLERLICFADKYYSKSGDARRKTTPEVISSLQRHGAQTVDRFIDMLTQFGDPDTL